MTKSKKMWAIITPESENNENDNDGLDQFLLQNSEDECIENAMSIDNNSWKYLQSIGCKCVSITITYEVPNE